MSSQEFPKMVSLKNFVSLCSIIKNNEFIEFNE